MSEKSELRAELADLRAKLHLAEIRRHAMSARVESLLELLKIEQEDRVCNLLLALAVCVGSLTMVVLFCGVT